MSTQKQIEPLRTPKRRSRGCLLWLGGLVVVVLGLILVRALYEYSQKPLMCGRIPRPVRW